MDPAIPAISSVTSEALQATVRRLLPSQQGFGVELAASNVITPIIDLTPTAEGSVLPESLQQAINFGGMSTFAISNTNSVILNNPGFWRIQLTATIVEGSVAIMTLDDGATLNTFFSLNAGAGGGSTNPLVVPLDFIVFMTTGDTLRGSTNAATCHINGNYRQVADVNGNLVNPVGFTFE
jgi:hypothetical protein